MPPQALRFRNDGTFTIVQFTDLHWHDGTGLDVCTASLMEMVLDAERPDLVVLTGDVLQGSECPDAAAAWRQAVGPMEQRSIPWVAVFGNHDDEGLLGRHELMAVQRSCRMCLSEPGPSSLPGVGNYVLDVRSSRRSEIAARCSPTLFLGVPGAARSPGAPVIESSSPKALLDDRAGGSKTRPQPPDRQPETAASLYFLDSGSYAPDGDGYAAISIPQIEWFRESVRHRISPGEEGSSGPAPSLVFLHIPLPEFELAWRSGCGRGFKLEDVQCPRLNTGFFAAVQAVGVLAVFAGHDHINDFDAEWQDVRLCYGRATGFRTYGQDGFAHGARLIRMIEGDRRFETWLRLDDGGSMGQIPKVAKS
jgi:hypothetical protein